MRKRLITPTPEHIRTRGEDWLDVERAPVVEVTSEDSDFPVESKISLGADAVLPAYRDGAKTYVCAVVKEFDC
jgi:hypothetical protein